MDFNPIANIFPLLTGQEFDDLKADIIANGLIEPIWLDLDGKILDGRNRWRACNEAGIEPRFRPYDGEQAIEAMIRFVVSLNEKRRHLSSNQKAAAAVKATEIMAALQAEARERQRMAGVERAKAERNEDGTFNQLSQTFDKAGDKPDPNANRTDETAAALFGTNRQYVSDAQKLKRQAPALFEDVANGKLTIPEAKMILRLPEDRQERVRQSVNGHSIRRVIREVEKEIQQKTVTPVKSEFVLVGDMREVGLSIPDNSINLIFTDPPYDSQAVPLYGELAKLAARVLKPGGICLTYSGQFHLPRIFPLMSDYLEYMWLCGIGHLSGPTWFKKWNLDSQWKPLLMYGKPPVIPYWDKFDDFVSGGREKSYHEWQQAVSEAEHYIQALCPLGGTVLDPFLGSGTTLVAAKNLNRQYLGIEKDDFTAMVALERVNNASN